MHMPVTINRAHSGESSIKDAEEFYQLSNTTSIYNFLYNPIYISLKPDPFRCIITLLRVSKNDKI